LFPGLFNEKDIIYITNKKIDDYIFSLSNFKGGVRNSQKKNIEKYFDKPLYTNTNFSNYKEYRRVLKQLDNQDNYMEELELALYYNLLKFENDKKIIYNDLHVLIRYFGLFLDYVGKLISNDTFIYSIVKKYKDNTIQNLTFENFETLFKNWYISVMKPYDNPFLGFIDEEDKKKKNNQFTNNNDDNSNNNDDDDDGDDSSDESMITPEESENIFKLYLETMEKIEKNKTNKSNRLKNKTTRKRSRSFIFSPYSSTRSKNKTKKILKL
jgi:hypothetical protein